ncbi:MAG: hypothetical protein IPN68_09945 [Bacteroidetes bacterium]|nr:hypothetical protein [Bacteroidota bacterium]
MDLFGASVSLWLERKGVATRLEDFLGQGSSYITRVSVEVKLFEIFSVEVTIEPPLEEATRIVEAGIIGMGFSFNKSNSAKSTDGKPGPSASIVFNKLWVQIEYSGRKTPIFKSLLMSPEIRGTDQGLSITLRGVGMLFQSTQINPAGRQLTGTKEEEIKNLLDTNMVQLSISPKAKQKLQGQLNNNFTETNYQVVQKIVKSSGCVMYYAGGSSTSKTITQAKQVVKIVTVEESRQRFYGDKKRAFQLVAFKQIRPDAGEFPIIAFDTSLSQLVGPFASRGGVRIDYDSETKQVEERAIDNTTYSEDRSKVDSSVDGSVPGGAQRDTDAFDKVEDTRTPFGMLADKIGIAADSVSQMVFDYFDRASRFNLTVIGPADIMPGRMVRVNIGDIRFLTGNYDLIGVTHQIDSSGYQIELECVNLQGFVPRLSTEAANIKNAAIEQVKNTKTPVSIR